MAAMKVLIPESVVNKLAGTEPSPSEAKNIIRTLEDLGRAGLEGGYQVPLASDPAMRIISAGKYRILFKAWEDRGLVEVLDISPAPVVDK